MFWEVPRASHFGDLGRHVATKLRADTSSLKLRYLKTAFRVKEGE